MVFAAAAAVVHQRNRAVAHYVADEQSAPHLTGEQDPLITRKLLRRIVGLGPSSSIELDAPLVQRTTATAFALAVDLRFGTHATHDQVQRFVTQIRGPRVAPEALNPVLAEQVLEAMYREHSLLGSTSPTEVLSAQNLMTYALVHETNLFGGLPEQFVREAAELIGNHGTRAG
ncbi:hypothetical protein [Kineosporia babensis]|uniref:Uncharacterized protein n=1 Tax=Kineosporia babensis TaxID=499548 RepID=A0A9X1NE49_9ACTN|nr:hypothetical protein [Kineosporia babensis]MCD5312395.1 hypothetical protein [Kineosporia babensis]